MMASSFVLSPVTNTASRAATRRRKKKRSQLLSAQTQDANNNNSSVEWKSEAEQEVYSSRLLGALRMLQLSPPSPTAPKGGRAMREVADRFLAINNDEVMVQDAISEKLGNFIHYMATFVSGFVVGFTAAWQLALTTLAVVPFIVVIGAIHTMTLANLSGKSQDALSKAGNIVEQTSDDSMFMSSPEISYNSDPGSGYEDGQEASFAIGEESSDEVDFS